MSGQASLRYRSGHCRATVFHMLSQAARIQIVALLALSFGLVVGCTSQVPKSDVRSQRASTPEPSPKPPAIRPLGVAERAAVVAVKQVGVPYRYGGSNRSGFDCSGLVHYAYSQAGLTTPRTTGALWRQLAPVSNRDLRVGDVLFFDIAGKVAHVGLYLGDGRFVHAPSSGKEVTIASLSSDYYQDAFVRGGRPR